MRPLIKRLLSAFFLLMVITGCSAAQPKNTSAGPTAVQGAAKSTVVPTSDPSKSTVVGAIVVDMDGKVVPIKNTNIFLSPILKDKNGVERVAQFDRAQCPFTQTDEQGNFTFTNVPAGRYVIILDEVVQSFLLSETSSAYTLMLTATAGKTTDLKTLHYHTLPVTPVP
jgi:hypothetical protein